jgi:hypothetical protein
MLNLPEAISEKAMEVHLKCLLHPELELKLVKATENAGDKK